jgi:dTDP-4-amino-4,6-dideoxygalactose transaminase
MRTARTSDLSPTVSGGRMLFPEGLPLAVPGVADAARVQRDVARILDGGVLTNGPLVRELEDRAAEYLGVRHCVAVSSCTAGLMLVLRAMDLTGDVLVPSFTFAATAHAVAWNGLRPVFVDVDPDALTVAPEAARRAVGVRTSAILATHVFGTPCAVEELEDIADRAGIRLVFDAAHAFGSRHADRMIGGFGDAEVFSLSPTKVLVAAEGGLITTGDDLLAERCRIGRDYGNPGDYDCRVVGLNARMSELHAAVALASFEDLEERVIERGRLASVYRSALSEIPGLSFPTVPQGDRSTFKDLTILVDRGAFGVGPDELAQALAREGIETRRYYSPPVHTMRAYRATASYDHRLPVTNEVASRALTLPLWTGMSDEQIERVAHAIRRSRGTTSDHHGRGADGTAFRSDDRAAVHPDDV